MQTLEQLQIPESETDKKWVWVPDKIHAFQPACIVQESVDSSSVRFKDGRVLTFQNNEIEKMNPAKFNGAHDLAELTFLNEASVIFNLLCRYSKEQIYTYSGLFLVAVNPYKRLNIYTESVMKSYKGKKRNELPPHIYAVADSAYNQMIQSQKDQSILITGESGAGKTENTKIVIKYLASVTPGDENLDSRILQANPILESFGNAMTKKNNNSSRFVIVGKFIRVQFNQLGRICSANIERYLLEKSRVTNQNPEERNYHVFYQLINGADSELKKELFLENATSFRYVHDIRHQVQGINDSVEFKNLLKAMKVMQFSDSEKLFFFKVVAIILHLGNISVLNDSSDQAYLPQAGLESCEKACKLLGLESDKFIQTLVRPKIKAGRDWVTQARSSDQVLYSIDALARALYEEMFECLVDRINLSIYSSSEKSTFIGVLDIAGFEIFQKNGFEQFCINYTNEKLQQFFNHFMFITEQEEYRNEGIEWSFIDFGLDLQPTIDLIEKNSPIGIFSLLDEECVMPKATDITFLQKLNSLKSHNKFIPSRFQTGFAIRHYAGNVEYTTHDWLDKNKDPLNEQITTLFCTSTFPDIARLFGRNEKSSITKRGAFRTTGQKHREQLSSLMKQLNTTTPYFVRCILPNLEKKSCIMDSNLVLDQLRCNGVLEGIRICRAGFPNRTGYLEFQQRYRLLKQSDDKQYSLKSFTSTLLQELNIDQSFYKLGHGKLANLEELRDAKLVVVVTKIQAVFRGFFHRNLFKRKIAALNAIKIIQKNCRLFIIVQQNTWWKLFSKIRPLLNIKKTEEEMESLKDALFQSQERLRIQGIEREKIEMAKANLENEKKKVEDELVSERDASANQSAILARAQNTQLELQEEISRLKNELTSRNSNIQQLEKTKLSIQTQLEETRVIQSEQKSHIAKIESLVLVKEENVKELSGDLELQIQKCARLESEKSAVESELESLRINHEFSYNQIHELTDNQKTLKLAHQELESRFNDLSAENFRIKTINSEYEVEIHKSRQTICEYLRDLSNLKNSLDSKNIEVHEISSDLKNEKEVRVLLDKKFMEFEMKYKTLLSEYNFEKAERENLVRTNKKLGSEIQSLSNLIAHKGSEENKQYDLLKLREKEIGEIREQMSIQTIEVSNIKRSTAKEIEELKAVNSEISGQLTNIQTVKANLEDRLLKLTNEMDHKEASLTELLKDKLALEDRIFQLSSANSTLENQVSSLESTNRISKASLDSISSELKESEMRANRLESEKSTLLVKLHQLTSEVSQESEKYLDLSLKFRRQSEELRHSNTEIVALNESIQGHISKIDSISKSHESLKTELSNCQIELSNVNESKRALNFTVSTQNDQITSLNSELENLKKTKARMCQDLEDLNIHLDKTNEALRKSEKAYASVNQKMTEFSSQLEISKVEKEEAVRNAMKLGHTVQSLKEELSEQSRVYDILARNKGELEKELKALAHDSRPSEIDRKKLDMEVMSLSKELQETCTQLQNTINEKAKAEETFVQHRRKLESDLYSKESEAIAMKRLLMKEINFLGDSLEAAVSDKAKVEDKCKSLFEKVQILSKFQEQTEKSSTDMETKFKKSCVTIEELNSRIVSMSNSLVNAEELAARFEAKSNMLSSQTETLESAIDSLKREKRTLETKCEQLYSELHGPEDSRDVLLEERKRLEIENKEISHQLQEERDQKLVIKLELERLNLEYSKLAKIKLGGDEISKLEESKRALAATVRLQSLEIDDLKNNLEAVEKQKKIHLDEIYGILLNILELRSNLDYETLQKSQEQINSRKIQAAISDLKIKLDSEISSRNKLEHDLQSMNSILESTKFSLEKTQSEFDNISRLKVSAENQISDLKSSLEQAEAAASIAREKAKILESQLQDFKDCSAQEDLHIESLKQSQAAQLAQLEKMHAEQIETNHLHESILDSIRQKYEAEIASIMNEYNTANSLLETQKNVTVDLKEQLFSMEAKAIHFQESISTLEKEYSRCKSKLEIATSAESENEKSRTEIKERLDKSIAENSLIKSQLEEVKSKFKEVSENAVQLETKVFSLTNANQVISAESKELEARLKMSISEKSRISESLEELQDSVFIISEKLKRSETKYSLALSELKTEREKYNSLRQSNRKLDESLKIMAQKVLTIEMESKQNSFTIAKKYEAEINEFKLRIEKEDLEKKEVIRASRRNERMVKDLMDQIEEKEVSVNRLSEEVLRLSRGE